MTAKADTNPLREALEKIASESTQWRWTEKDTADTALAKIAVQMREVATAALASEPVAGTVRDAAVAEAYRLFPDEIEPSEHPLGKIVVDRGSIRYGFLAGVNFALSLPPQGRGVEVRCYGCGSAWTDDDLRAARAKDPQIISCCPERKPLNITEWMARAVAAEFNLRATPPAPGAADRAEWQPIDTAPKDGKEINGYRPDQGVFTFRWAEMSEFVDEDAVVDGHDYEFACWWHDRWGWMENDLTPTLWRPLPEEPTLPRANCGGSDV